MYAGELLSQVRTLVVGPDFRHPAFFNVKERVGPSRGIKLHLPFRKSLWTDGSR